MIKCLRMDRICTLYDPQGIMEALSLPESAGWLGVTSPIPNHRQRRGPVYHRGRVCHFVNLLLADQLLEPIEVCHEPLEFFLSDGHHRFMAHLYAGRETILAAYSGSPDVLRYLQGKRKTCPKL